MAKRPVIGITVDTSDATGRYESPTTYARAVESAGGQPVLLPYKVDHALVPGFVDLIDGMLFSGGNDLDPSVYGEDWHPRAIRIDPDRQAFEMAMLAEIERRRMPALGVCLGSQLMNVYRGGSLIQFLPEHERGDALEHRTQRGETPRRHPVRINPESIIGRCIGKSEISTNTYHKQAVKNLGRGLKVVATAPDGVIEAFEDPTLPLFIAIQWHPERLIDEPEHLAPFKLLVEKAAASKT
jgi:putative glutamine amidotransferase